MRACVALEGARKTDSVGAALWAAYNYGADLLVVSGSKRASRTWQGVTLLEVGDVFDAMPAGCVPVAVDRVAGAEPLMGYSHPERAFYVFGAEDSTLSGETLARCRDKVTVPTRSCMSLAAAVNVVLYDRMAKAR